MVLTTPYKIEMEIDKISVIGLGYIGLPTALMFAKANVKVEGIDYNHELVQKLKNGVITFEENGLQKLFLDALNNNIEFTTEYKKNNMYIIAVPTPYIKESKKIDEIYVTSAFKEILKVCDHETIVVIESTISPGTIEKYINPLIKNSNKILHLVHAPERIIPGNMVFELENNSRTIGCDSVEIGEKVKEIYSKFCKGKITLTSIKTAEMTKVVENTYRDVNIAFANELAKICNEAKLNVYEVIQIANQHPRVNILNPGPGVGGHCISVDPWFLVGDFPSIANLIHQARIVNDSMPKYVLDKILDIKSENMINENSKIGIYGLTYKDNVDDIRESPTLQLIEFMKKESIDGFKFYDPFVKNTVVKGQYLNFSEFLKDLKLLVIMTSHDHIIKYIKGNDFNSNIIILDTKNCANQNKVKKLYQL